MFLNARLVAVSLSFLSLFLAGCEERVEPEFGGAAFELLRPTPGSNVTDTGETSRIKLEYEGAGITLSTIYIELNGADITDEFAVNNISDVAIASFASVRNALVQGENTLLVGQMLLDSSNQPVLGADGRPQLVISETFTFTVDDRPPRLVVSSAVAASTNPDGTPQAGTTLTVEGDIVETSLMESLVFTYPGGSVTLVPTNNDPVGVNQYNDTTKKFSVNLPNYPNVAAATSEPHFSYTAMDEFELKRTERFMASGTAISRQQALQINDSLTANIGPLANTAIKNGITLAKGLGLFPTGAPQQMASGAVPAPDGLMKNPMFPISSCQTVTEVPQVMVCTPPAYGGNTMVYIYPSVFDPARNATLCASVLFKASEGVTHCAAFINDIDLSGINVDVDFAGNGNPNNLKMILEMLVNHASVDIEIAGITVADPLNPGNFPDAVYQGSLKGVVAMGEFAIYTPIKLFPDPNYLINASRTGGFRLYMNDLLKVPQVYAKSCDICAPGSQPVFGFALLALALGIDASGNGIADKKDVVRAVEDYIEGMAGPLLDSAIAGLLPAATRVVTNQPVNDKLIIRNSRVVDGHTVYGNNAHMVFNGSDVVEPTGYAPAYAPVNGGLGSVFQAQGSYFSNLAFWVTGWPLFGDLTYGISANAVNQWLLANHQSGMFDEYEMTLTGADVGAGEGFAAAFISAAETDELSLTFNTHEAPSVIFRSEDTTSFKACNGTSLCLPEDTKSPGSARLTINNVDVHLDNLTAPAAVIDANMNIELEVILGVSAGRPQLSIKENSVRVQVNSFTVPSSSVLVTNASMAFFVEQAIEGFMTEATLTGMLSQKFSLLSLADLPGSGGSGVDCLGPSVNGQICVGGNQLSYSTLLFGLLPRDFSLLVNRLTIEPSGSYLTVSLDIRNGPSTAVIPASFYTVRMCAEKSTDESDLCYEAP